MDRTEYIEELKDRLEEWAEEIDEIEELLSGENEDENDSEMETVRDLRTQLENLRLTLDELEQSDDDSWEEMQASMEVQLEEFEESFSEAKEAVKEE